MAGKRLPVCKLCGRKFRPDPHNHHHQVYCTRPECRAELARSRKRKYYRQRLDKEEGFRETERERCRAAMRRLRAKRKKAEKEAVEKAALCLPAVPPVEALLVGLVSQLGGTTDPHAVADMMNAYADRGRRLAVPDGNRGSP